VVDEHLRKLGLRGIDLRAHPFEHVAESYERSKNMFHGFARCFFHILPPSFFASRPASSPPYAMIPSARNGREHLLNHCCHRRIDSFHHLRHMPVIERIGGIRPNVIVRIAIERRLRCASAGGNGSYNAAGVWVLRLSTTRRSFSASGE
jgi:hypothetical protein